MSDRGRMMSLNDLLPKSKIFSMYAASLVSSAPSPTASCTSVRIMSSVTRLPADRCLPTIRVMKNSATWRITSLKGVIRRANSAIGRHSALAKATLLRIASTFGVISPNSSRIGTITSRLIISFSAPKRWMTIAAEITDAETLTNSLPIRMVTISRRGSLRSRSISSMRGFLAARIWSI